MLATLTTKIRHHITTCEVSHVDGKLGGFKKRIIWNSQIFISKKDVAIICTLAQKPSVSCQLRAVQNPKFTLESLM